MASLFSSNDDIITMIMDGDYDDFGAEKLKGLMKILPEMVRLRVFTTKSYSLAVTSGRTLSKHSAYDDPRSVLNSRYLRMR